MVRRGKREGHDPERNVGIAQRASDYDAETGAAP
jgi:hypothetical protein